MNALALPAEQFPPLPDSCARGHVGTLGGCRSSATLAALSPRLTLSVGGRSEKTRFSLPAFVVLSTVGRARNSVGKARNTSDDDCE
jgi:hypothetical protein